MKGDTTVATGFPTPNDVKDIIGQWFVCRRTPDKAWLAISPGFDNEAAAINYRDETLRNNKLEVRQIPEVTQPPQR